MSLVKIATACAVECERQMVGIRELGFLLEAYQWVSDPDADRAARFETVETFEILGSFVEPGKNRYGFRKVPVTFANGGSSANASEVPRFMEQLVEVIQEYMKPATSVQNADQKPYPEQIVKQFLWIHPFADGNGRVGFLLYNYLMGTLDEPLALPDFGW